MAEFRMIGKRQVGARAFVIRDNGVVEMNPRATKLLYVARAEVEITTDDGQLINRHVSVRDTIEAPDGAQILPYFKSNGEWQLVMVEQFRIAIPGKTLEAAGGEVDEKNPRESMARELEEEAHLHVRPDEIELVFCEGVQPSMMAARIWGGIVGIDKSQLPSELLGGEFAAGEYTVLVTKPLLELLRDRDAMKISLDLMASRLIDEVAKRVGLLVKNY